ncbi:MAG: adenosylcobinamide-GDP ribazoletransferase [Lachnospiraceae bacterium]|nr:adenosylcobinamide-GDP ribazoletransferase [Lachnospiraceae bacterium]
MKTLFESCIVAFGMYSKIPVPPVEWNEKNMRLCICFFPLIGIPAGLLMWGWQILAGVIHAGALLRAAVFCILPVLLTGGIHMDGFLDTADALSSHKSQEEKLRILSDSRCGAFAILSGICYFLLYLGAAGELSSGDFPGLISIFVLSRALSGLGLLQLRKAKGSGLLKTFSDAADLRTVTAVMILWLTAAGIAVIVLSPVKGAAVCAVCLLVFLWYRHMSYTQFGGITGDLAGCFLQVCELAALLIYVLL